MKNRDILGHYCHLYGVTMPKIDRAETRYFVAFSGEGMRVLYLRNPSALLGRIVCGAMKRGTVLYLHNGSVRPLTWESWRDTWAKLFAPKPRKSKLPEPNNVGDYRSEVFETMQTTRPYKKPRNRGFARGYIANISMNRLA